MKQTKTITRSLHFAGTITRANGSDPECRTITGRSIVFNSPATVYEDEDSIVMEQVAPEAVTRDLLDASDVVMTMFHDSRLILARSNHGKGTLSYDVSPEGVDFRFDAPCTVDGEKALALVSRGDICGCSFQGVIDRYDDTAREFSYSTAPDGRTLCMVTIHRFVTLRDFTLTHAPVYEDTSVAVEYRDVLHSHDVKKDAECAAQVAEMIAAASSEI